MITVFLFIVLILVALGSSAQVTTRVQSAPNTDSSYQFYIFGTNPVRVVASIKDSTIAKFMQRNIQFSKMDSTRTDAAPSSNNGLLWSNSSGFLRRTQLSAMRLNQSNIIGLQDSLNTKITTETDPVYTAGIANYYNKTQSDSRYYSASNPNSYISSFTEVDPISVHKTDSAAMLAPYLRKSDTSSLSSRVNTKLNISDTLNKWYSVSNPSGYITAASISNKLNITDTSLMLSPYLRKTDTLSLSNRINSNTVAITLKLNKSDTSAMLSTYAKNVNIPTNNNQLTNGNGYISSYTETDPLSLHLTDSSSMLNPYLRKTDTASLSNRINLRLLKTDTTAMLLPYAKTNAIPTNTNQLTNGAGFITSSSLTPYKLVSDSGRGTSNYVTGYTLNKVKDSLAALITTPSINYVTRTINSSTYTISTTKQASVCYNLTISCTASIGSAATGSVALMYSTNGGSTYTTVATVSNSNTVTLAVTLNSVQISGLQLCGVIPANALVKLVPTTAGTTVINYLNGQEVL